MKIKKFPTVSAVITTYNSERTLKKVIKSIRNQNYDQNKIEIMIIDGGSQDNTLKIAKESNCEIIHNPKTDQVYGKFIGYKKAKGEFLLLIDSDEVLDNKNSILNKVNSILTNKKVNVSISSGLKKPKSYPHINYYLNEFGDPFSFFMYHSSRDPQFFIKNLKKKYKIVAENENEIVFDFTKDKNPPFIELTAMAVIINLKYIKKTFKEIFKSAPAHTHLFYLLNSKNNYFAIMKRDNIVHFSVSQLSGYLRKIRSRITSNIFGTNMGLAGFSGREKYHSAWFKYKKYLFIIYAFTLLWPIADSIYLTISRKKTIYLIHFPITIYTALLVVYFYTRKVLGIKTKTYNYGGK